MIVPTTLTVALRPPAANGAVRGRLRVGGDLASLPLNCVGQALLYVAIVSRVIQDPERFWRKIFVGYHDMHELRPSPLDVCYQLGIQRELKNGGRFRFQRKLAIVDFVGPLAEIASRGHSTQYIRFTKPLLVR